MVDYDVVLVVDLLCKTCVMIESRPKKKKRRKRVVKGWCESVECAIFHICNRVPTDVDECTAYIHRKVFGI